MPQHNGRVPFSEHPGADNQLKVKMKLTPSFDNRSKITVKLSPSKRHSGTVSSKSPDLKSILKNPLGILEYQSSKTKSIYEGIEDPLTQTSTTTEYVNGKKTTLIETSSPNLNIVSKITQNTRQNTFEENHTSVNPFRRETTQERRESKSRAQRDTSKSTRRQN